MYALLWQCVCISHCCLPAVPQALNIEGYRLRLAALLLGIMDRRVISPSLVNPNWGDMTRPFNPDFNLDMRDFLPRWDLADVTFPALLEDQTSSLSVLPNPPDVAVNGQATPRIIAASSSQDAEVAENPPPEA